MLRVGALSGEGHCGCAGDDMWREQQENGSQSRGPVPGLWAVKQMDGRRMERESNSSGLQGSSNL